MPNPFPGLRFIPQAARLGSAYDQRDMLGRLTPTWSNPPLDLQDLPLWRGSVDVRPVAIPNPYTDAWSDVAWPSDLWCVISRIPVTTRTYGQLGITLSKVVAVAWKWAPPSAVADETLTITDASGSTLYTETFTASGGPKQGIWYLPDTQWDNGAHRITADTADRFYYLSLAIIQAPGFLVPRDLPSGWDSVTGEPGSHAGAARLFPVTASSGPDWSARYAGGLSSVRSSVGGPIPAAQRPAPAFPQVWTGTAWQEAMNAPWFDDLGPGKVDLPYIPPGSSSCDSQARGCIRWRGGSSDSGGLVASFDIASTRPYALFMPAISGLTLVYGHPGSGAYVTGGSVHVRVKEWGSGNLIVDQTVTIPDMSAQPTDYRGAISLTLTDPGLGADDVWEVSAAIECPWYNYIFPWPTMSLRVEPLYTPVPFPAMAADGSRLISGGTKAGRRRTVDPRLLPRRITAAGGALTASGSATQASDASTDWIETQAAFTPDDAGWYRPTATLSAGSTSVAAHGDDERLPPRWAIAPYRAAGLPFLATAGYWWNASAGTLTVDIARVTPSHVALSSSWALVAPSDGICWAKFTAPADGTFRIEVGDSRSSGTPPDPLLPHAPRFSLYVGADADVLADPEAVWEAALVLGYESQWRITGSNTPLTYDPGQPTVVGLGATGAWADHAGQLAYARPQSGGSMEWDYQTPPAGLVAMVPDADGVQRWRIYRDGSWSAWHPTITKAMTSGQTLYLRIHGERGDNSALHGHPTNYSMITSGVWARAVAV